MQKQLNLFEEKIPLPFEILKRHTLIAGESGSGKSYFVGVLCEELSRLDVPFIIIDTQNSNLGLLKLPNTYLIDPSKDSAQESAQLIAGTNMNAIINNPASISLSQLRAFCNSFIREYIKREQKALRILIVDEAHLHAPRMGSSDDSEILKRIATSFRSEGLFLYCSTQRVVELDTTIGNESPNKFLFRLTGLNDAQRLLDILKLRLPKREAEVLVQEVQNYGQGECVVISNVEFAESKNGRKSFLSSSRKLKKSKKKERSPKPRGIYALKQSLRGKKNE